MGKLNAGVIGLGLMGQRHARIYAQLPLINLKAIADSNQTRLDQMVSQFQAKGYLNYEELLADSDIDAVSICLPDNLHYAAVKSALKQHKHILVEKPITTVWEEALAIQKIIDDQKVFMVGHILRFDPRYAMAQEAIHKGELGKIGHITGRRNSPILGPKYYAGHADLASHVMVHDIDIINWYLQSKIKKVFAQGKKNLLKEFNMFDTILTNMEYEDGTMVSLEASWVLPEATPGSIDGKMEVVGDKGTLYIDSFEEGLMIVNQQRTVYPDTCHWPEINGYVTGDLQNEIIHFLDCILNKKKPIVTLQDAIQALEITILIEKSIATNKVVTKS